MRWHPNPAALWGSATAASAPALSFTQRTGVPQQGFNDQEIVALSGAHALGRCHTDRSGYVSARPPDAACSARQLETDVLPCARTYPSWSTACKSVPSSPILPNPSGARADPWTFAPTTFSNQYFVLLRDEKWCAPLLGFGVCTGRQLGLQTSADITMPDFSAHRSSSPACGKERNSLLPQADAWCVLGCRKKKNWKGPLQYEDSSKSLMMLPTDMVRLRPFPDNRPTWRRHRDGHPNLLRAPLQPRGSV